MARGNSEVLQGTLDLLMLKAVSLGPLHGWGISQRIHQFSENILQVNQGSLYPALHRLEQRSWLAAQWGQSENNRRAKYYRLTDQGSRHLQKQERDWRRFVFGVDQVLATR